MSHAIRAIACLLALTPVPPGHVLAQSPSGLGIELNRLEPRDGGACRVWLVLRNDGAEALNPVRLDLVLFGRDGVVARRLAVDVGPLPAGRTQARIFDISAQGCDTIGHLLLNDLLAFGITETAARSACIDRLDRAARIATR